MNNEFTSVIDKIKAERERNESQSVIYIAQCINNPWPYGGGIPFGSRVDAEAFVRTPENMGTNSVVEVKIRETLI
jgi:hypothetical protein